MFDVVSYSELHDKCMWLTNELTAIALRIPDLEPAVDQISQALRDSECFRAAGIAVLESDEE